MGDWLESYARIMELNFWGRSECRQARFDEAAGEWEAEIDRDGERVVLRPRQLVLCTGAYGPPRMPEIAGAGEFRGKTMHSASYRDGAGWKGRNCVVIGSNTSAHDVCADLWESGAGSVTMVQRSPSTVVTSDSLLDITFGGLYSEQAVAEGITTDRADLIFASIPFALMADLHRGLTAEMQERDCGLLRRLRDAGFLLDFGCDGSGLVMKAFRTGSGYYIDVGCSELIASGKVAVRSGVEPVRFTPGTLVLSDDSRIKADLVVFCTGYHSMQQTIGRLLSEVVAERVGHCWGYGSSHTRRSGAVGRRNAQFVETDRTGRAVAAWRQSPSLTLLFKIRGAADQGKNGGCADARLRAAVERRGVRLNEKDRAPIWERNSKLGSDPVAVA